MAYKKGKDRRGVSPTAHYYKPKGESEENLQIMKKIDKEHIEHPAKGVVGIDDYNYHRRHQRTNAASKRIINLLIMPSGQEEKATGLNQSYSTKQALHSSGSLVLIKNNTVPV